MHTDLYLKTITVKMAWNIQQHTTVLLLVWNMSGPPGSAGTRKVKPRRLKKMPDALPDAQPTASKH